MPASVLSCILQRKWKDIWQDFENLERSPGKDDDLFPYRRIVRRFHSPRCRENQLRNSLSGGGLYRTYELGPASTKMVEIYLT